MPALPAFTDGWQLGKPDLVLEMRNGFELPAGGPDVYRNFVLPTGLTEDRWVRAIELRPRARRAVHHALFAYATGGSLSRRDGADGRPGFSGNMAVGVLPGPGGSGGLGGWAVGGRAMVFPDGMSPRLPAGSDFLLQVHFHPNGIAETERSTVGLYFSDTAPTKAAASIELPALFGFGAGIDIPAGEANYTIRDEFTLPADVRVHSGDLLTHATGERVERWMFCFLTARGSRCCGFTTGTSTGRSSTPTGTRSPSPGEHVSKPPSSTQLRGRSAQPAQSSPARAVGAGVT